MRTAARCLPNGRQEIGLNEYLFLDVQQKEESLYGVNLEFVVYSENGEPGTAATVLYHSTAELEDGIFMIDETQVPKAAKDRFWNGRVR